MTTEQVLKYSQNIREYVKENKFKEAFKELEDISFKLKNEHLRDSIIQVWGRFKHLKHEIQIGVMSFERREISLNQIRKSILDIVKLVESGDFSEEKIQRLFTNQNKSQKHSGVGDNIGGDKIVINFESISDRTNELTSILKLRAEEINRSLSNHYHHVDVKEYLDKFNSLHLQHIDALENKSLFLAHELLIKIHDISFFLQKSEFWTSQENQHPAPVYNLGKDSFSRGEMICNYIVGELVNYSNKYPIGFSKFEDYSLKEGEYKIYKEKDILNVYSLILNSII